MLNFSKPFNVVTLKKSTSILMPVALALGLSACSSDVARFALLNKQASQAPSNSVQQSGLPPLAANSGQQAYNQVSQNGANSEFTASIPSSTIAQSNGNNWSGNSSPDTYRISTGDTLYSVSRRFGISVEALRQANNLDQFSSLRIGQQIFLPRQSNVSMASNSPKTSFNSQPAEINTLPQSSSLQRQFVKPVASNGFAPVQQASTGSGAYVVKAGDTLYSIARAHGVHVNTIKSLNSFSGAEGLRIGQQIQVNGSAAAPAVVAVQKPAPVKAAPQKQVALAKPDPRSSSRFRWPVSGRVISEYGKKSDGRRNDGLNVAVPPGTVVKAAENGVVAYSGSGLKSYGNLILIKHSGGWVTAYAHNGSILVKKGDKVRRGQAIARSGQSGDVTKPQLHFEIRRGALAVNPRKYLSSK